MYVFVCKYIYHVWTWSLAGLWFKTLPNSLWSVDRAGNLSISIPMSQRNSTHWNRIWNHRNQDIHRFNPSLGIFNLPKTKRKVLMVGVQRHLVSSNWCSRSQMLMRLLYDTMSSPIESIEFWMVVPLVIIYRWFSHMFPLKPPFIEILPWITGSLSQTGEVAWLILNCTRCTKQAFSFSMKYIHAFKS